MRIVQDQSGAVAIEAALTIPMLVALCAITINLIQAENLREGALSLAAQSCLAGSRHLIPTATAGVTSQMASNAEAEAQNYFANNRQHTFMADTSASLSASASVSEIGQLTCAVTASAVPIWPVAGLYESLSTTVTVQN